MLDNNLKPDGDIKICINGKYRPSLAVSDAREGREPGGVSALRPLPRGEQQQKGKYISKYKNQYYRILVCNSSFYFLQNLKD